jgi:hydrogenase expression/formation protein HypE
MTVEFPEMEGLVCPVPLSHNQQIVLGHGSGGKMSHELIARTFLPAFDNPALRAGDDAGSVQPDSNTRLAVSTDSHVVWPLFFPGGDIGRLAVCGTVNDVSMLGANPLYLTAGFILEEGLPFSTLEQVVASMQIAANEAGVEIVAGDTKVVERGKADGLYITTTGIGTIPAKLKIGGARARPGDQVILSGTIGDHGIAVLEARGELGFESGISSDVAPLNHMIAEILQIGETEGENEVHVLRDPTRGGLATTLNEIARQSGVSILLNEETIPVRPAVSAACEMLGFDPLYIANEGKLIAIVRASAAERVLRAMRTSRYGAEAALIGEVASSPAARVLMKTTLGTTRIVDVLMGEMLPRIC